MAIRDVPSFGDLLRRYRHDAGITQDELAAAVGLSWRDLNALERGEGLGLALSADLVARLADALRLTPAAHVALLTAANHAQPASGPSAAASAAGAMPVQASEHTQPKPQHLPVGRFLGALPQGPLVAREAELAKLLATLDAVAHGAGRLVLLVGEPGVGKTRLAQEVTRAALDRGFLVAAGRCYEPQEAVAYYPFLEALGMAEAAAPPAISEQVAHRWPDVVRLLPDTPGEGPAPTAMSAPSAGGRDEQQRLFWQVTGFLVALAERCPVALLLDDLHWADSASLDLAQHLARHTRSSRLLLVGTYRDVEVSREHPLEAALRDLARDHLLERVPVKRLSAAGTRALIAATLSEEGRDGAEASDDFARLLYSRTEGNPFFTQEVLHALIEQGDVARPGPGGQEWDRTAVEAFELPESVRSVIGQRISRLSPSAQEVLREASVVGQTFAFEVLRAMGGREEAEVEATLEEGVAAGLVRETDQSEAGEDGYAFSHALIQQALYRELPSRKKRRLHREAGEALEKLPAGKRVGRVAELAYHFLEADEGARALPYALQAGNQAEAVYAHVEAERHYRTVVELAGELDDRERQGEALEKLGQALGYLSRPADAIDADERAAQAYQALGDAEGELRALGAIASVQSYESIERAEAALARVLPRLAALEAEVTQAGRVSSGLASATLQTGMLYLTAGRPEEASDLVERAARFARELGDDALLAWACGSRGLSLYLSGGEGYLPHFLEGAALAERAERPDFLTIMLNFVTATYLFEGKLAFAKPYAERALAVAEQSQIPDRIAFMRVSLGEPALFGGNWGEAREHFSMAAAIWDRLDPNGTSANMAFASVYLGVLDLMQGRASDVGTRRLEAALARMPQSDFVPALQVGSIAEKALAERDLLMDQPTSARGRLVAFLDFPHEREPVGMADARAIALPVLAWAELELGHHAEATERLEAAIELATARRWHLWLVDALRVKGLLAVRQQRWEDARAGLDETITMCRSMSYPWAEAKALYVYGQLHAAKGEPEQAREKYEAALAICDRLGEGLYRPHIERALAELDLTP